MSKLVALLAAPESSNETPPPPTESLSNSLEMLRSMVKSLDTPLCTSKGADPLEEPSRSNVMARPRSNESWRPPMSLVVWRRPKGCCISAVWLLDTSFWNEASMASPVSHVLAESPCCEDPQSNDAPSDPCRDRSMSNDCPVGPLPLSIERPCDEFAPNSPEAPGPAHPPRLPQLFWRESESKGMGRVESRLSMDPWRLRVPPPAPPTRVCTVGNWSWSSSPSASSISSSDCCSAAAALLRYAVAKEAFVPSFFQPLARW
mmetsp:Transcript_7465/g.14564  ORF Transcript_7465/g.14564 Transcript_7465/m.14564 type:complete len:260 (-) Transcript_7465:933-1712(-)